jgi:integrase/recombinase XerD
MTVRVDSGNEKKDRITVLSVKCLDELRLYQKQHKPVYYLFEGKPGEPYSATSVANVLRKSAEGARIGVRVTPHMLRHSFATHLVEMQVNLRVIQKLLGHSKLETTAIYAHISNDMITNMPNPFDEIINLHEELQRIPANDTKKVSLARSRELL